MLSLPDRTRLELFIRRLDWHLTDLPYARVRQIRRELRANARSAAAELGMRQALANLGQPRALAAGYISAEGRPLPRYLPGVAWAVAAAIGYSLLVQVYGFGVLDGQLYSHGTGPVRTSFLGATVEAVQTAGGFHFGVTMNAWLLAVAAVAFLVGGRMWRLLPGLRGRRPSGSAA